jgi:hypothetical protein
MHEVTKHYCVQYWDEAKQEWNAYISGWSFESTAIAKFNEYREKRQDLKLRLIEVIHIVIVIVP